LPKEYLHSLILAKIRRVEARQAMEIMVIFGLKCKKEKGVRS